MANSFQRFRRVNQLPATREPDTMYVVRPAGATEATLVFTGSDPTVEVGIIGRVAIESIVNDAVAGHTSVHFYATYADMAAGALAANGICYVADITGDPLGGNGVGVYLYDFDNARFVKFPGGGGGTTPLEWNGIVGRPNSTPAAIDDAVGKAHSHVNKPTLDLITENAQQKLMYRGKLVADPATVQFVGSNW